MTQHLLVSRQFSREDRQKSPREINIRLTEQVSQVPSSGSSSRLLTSVALIFPCRVGIWRSCDLLGALLKDPGPIPIPAVPETDVSLLPWLRLALDPHGKWPSSKARCSPFPGVRFCPATGPLICFRAGKRVRGEGLTSSGGGAGGPSFLIET